MSVSEVTDYRLKWKLPFEQRRKGYEKIQFAMTDAVRSDCLCPGAPTGTARVLPESLQMTGASGVALPAAARRTQCDKHHTQPLFFSFYVLYGLLVRWSLCGLLS